MLKPIEVNKIIQGDAILEIEKLIQQGITVDAIITDPPYNLTEYIWDKQIINWEKMGQLFNKILKKSGRLIVFGMSPFYDSAMISFLENKFQFSTEIIWKKNMSNPLSSKIRIQNEHEKIMVLNHKNRNGKTLTYNPYTRIQVKQILRKNQNNLKHLKELKEHTNYESYINYPTSIYTCRQEFNSTHGTAKPYKLMEHLIKLYTNEDDLVLDPFAGSGTTLIAAKQNNRKYIGIELEPKFFQMAKTRVEQPFKYLENTQRKDELKNISLFKINETETDYNQHDYKNYSKTSEKNG